MLNVYLTITGTIILLATLALPTFAERPDRLFSDPQGAVRKGVDDVLRLVPDNTKSPKRRADDNDYAIALGFDSAQQAGNAQMGDSLFVYRARLDSFKQFFGDIGDLLIGTGSFLVTLNVNGNPKSSVTIARDPQTNKWHTVEWGNRRLIRLLEKQRQQHPGITFFLLISPANPWGLRFVGEQRAGQFFLTPLTTIDELQLPEGQEVGGAILVSKLRALANKQP